MDFRQIVENAKNNNTQFNYDFLDTLLTCQDYAKALKNNKLNGGNRKTENRLRELVKDKADTLRCFVNCCK